MVDDIRLEVRSDPRFLKPVRSLVRAWVEACELPQGEPCPPEHRQRRELSPPDPADLEPGGLGVQLIHRAFDEVTFCSGRESGNCVIMRRRRPGR